MANVTTVANVPQLLKRRYGDVGQTVPLHYDLFKFLQTAKKVKFANRDFIFPIIVAPGGAASPYAAGGKFPGPRNPVIRDATLPLTRLGTSIAADEQMWVSGKSDADGFLGNFDKIVKLTIENFKRRHNILIYGAHLTSLANGAVPATASRNGIINRISAVAGGPPVTSITVNRPLGYDDADLGSTRFARYLLQGDVFAYGTIAGTTLTVKGSLAIDDVNYSASSATVTILTSPGGQPAANDFIVYCDPDTASVNGYSTSAQGLGALIYQAADANGAQQIEGVTVQPNNLMGWSTPNIISGGPFSQSDWHQAVRTLEVVSNSDAPKAMVNDPTMADIYATTLFPDQRLVAQEAKGGRKTIPTFASGKGDIEQIYDDKCPYGMTFFLTKEQAFWLHLTGQELPSFYHGADGKQWKDFQMEDGVYAVFRWQYNLGLETLNSHAVARGVTVPNAPL